MSSSIAFLITLCAFLCSINVESFSQFPKLLVVSYDGFRYDYFDRDVTPYMKNLKKNGTHTDYMINVFPTLTFPNHHSIATGFYAENHGVLDSSLYVSDKKLGNSPELFQYNKSILPIWIINEKAGDGRHSGVSMWPGSAFEYNGTIPQFIQKHDKSIPWKKRIDSLISWFLDSETPINLGIMYIEEPDSHAHRFGINAPIINEQLRKIDEITKYLHEKLVESDLTNVNVIHLSDHGMVDIKMDKIVPVSNYINDVPYQVVLNKSTIVMINISDAGNEEKIYNQLKTAAAETNKFDVYRKSELPERYHFSRNPRVGDIIVIAKNGYVFEHVFSCSAHYKEVYNITVTSESEFGIHGYDNLDTNMHPMFFANGPAFRSGCKLDPFDNVDLFSLFCKILNLQCPTTKGTVESFSKCLSSLNDST